MNNSTSLLEFLTHANPQVEIKSRPKGSRSSTKNEKYPRPKKVERWQGFTANAIQTMFGGRLQQHLDMRADDFPDHSNIDQVCREIFLEPSLESVVVLWHQQVLLEALKRTSQHIIGQKVRMVKGDQALLAFDDSERFRPDWAGTNDIQREDQSPEPNNILPGDTKRSWNWTSDDLIRLQFDVQWPLRQLLFYCVRSCSRYGYMITDEELIIIRVSRHASAPEIEPTIEDSSFKFSYEVAKFPSVEFLSIPWSASGATGGMTMNLVLWILHILAANDGRLQAKPYKSLGQEKCIPREDQVAIPRVFTEEAREVGWSAKDKFEDQSFEGSLVQGATVKIAPLYSDTEEETDGETEGEIEEDVQGDTTDDGSEPLFSQQNSQQNSFADVPQSASSSEMFTTATRHSKRKPSEQHIRDSSSLRRSKRNKNSKEVKEKQRCRVPSSSRTRP